MSLRKRTPTNPVVPRPTYEWIAFLSPLVPFLAVGFLGQPAYLGAGIATAWMAAIGYRFTRHPALIRQFIGVTLLVLGTLFVLRFVVPVSGELADSAVAWLPFVASFGVGVAFSSVVWYFATTPTKGPTRSASQLQA